MHSHLLSLNHVQRTLAARVSGIAAQVRIQWLIMGAALLTLVGMAIAAAIQPAALP